MAALHRLIGVILANDFLPYKPGALHPVASAPIKALMCFCLYPPGADKFKPPALRVVVDFYF
jgi:hypothetical protein